MKNHLEILQKVSARYGLSLFEGGSNIYYLVNDDGQVIKECTNLEELEDLLIIIMDNYLLAKDDHVRKELIELSKLENSKEILDDCTYSDLDDYRDVDSGVRAADAYGINRGWW